MSKDSKPTEAELKEMKRLFESGISPSRIANRFNMTLNSFRYYPRKFGWKKVDKLRISRRAHEELINTDDVEYKAEQINSIIEINELKQKNKELKKSLNLQLNDLETEVKEIKTYDFENLKEQLIEIMNDSVVFQKRMLEQVIIKFENGENDELKTSIILKNLGMTFEKVTALFKDNIQINIQNNIDNTEDKHSTVIHFVGA